MMLDSSKRGQVVRYLKSSITVFSIISLVITISVDRAWSQSGRGRPKVSQPETPTTKRDPVSIPANTAVLKQEQLATTSRFVLRNGITVVISEQHAIPLAAAIAYFKDSATDPPGSALARRLLSRMVFGGTTLRPGERAAEELRSLGAIAEAKTSYDGTAFTLLSPPEKFKSALAIQADMIQSPSLDAALLSQELPLALEELRTGAASCDSVLSIEGGASDALEPDHLRKLDDPLNYAASRLLSVALAGGAVVDEPKSLTRDQLVEFYRVHYRPENLIVAIAGDISTFDALVTIQQAYGGFGVKTDADVPTGNAATTVKTKAASPSVATPIADPRKSNLESNNPTQRIEGPSLRNGQVRLLYSSERADISQSVVSVGFRVPGADSKDAPALQVLSAIAGIGRASRLNRALIDGGKVANRVDCGYVAMSHEGLLRVEMCVANEPREGASLDKAESTLFKELMRLRSEPPTDAELARAKTVLEKRFVDATGTYLGRASALAKGEAGGAGLHAMLDYSSLTASIRAEDVQRVAARYLTVTNTSIHEYEPFSAPARTFDSDTFAATLKAWAPAFDSPAEAARETKADQPAGASQTTERNVVQRAMLESIQPLAVKDFSTLNGPKAFVCEDHSQPKVTIAILFQGGRLVEDANTTGTTELMLRSLLYGTPRLSYSQVADELDGLGADVRVVAEPDFFGLAVSVLSRNSEHALKLLRDLIEEPAFREDDVARARLGQIASIREARDSSVSRSRELLFQALYPGHSYSLPPHGREEVISKLTAEKLSEWHARLVKRELPIAMIVGDTAGSALVSSQLAEGFRRRDPETSIQVTTPRADAPAEKAEARRNNRTTIAIGFPGPKAENADQNTIRVIEWSMRGEGGRLDRGLRNSKSAGLSASFEDKAMFAAGPIIAFAVAAPADEQKLRTSLVGQLEQLARPGLDSNELSSAQALFTTSQRALLQSQLEHALQYARAFFFRKSAADADAYAEQAAKVTLDDIKRVASTYIKASAAFAGVVRGTSPPPSTPPPPRQD